jgi:hypothetical protein
MQLQAGFGSLINIEANVWFRIRVTVISWERTVYVNKIRPGFSYWYMLKSLKSSLRRWKLGPIGIYCEFESVHDEKEKPQLELCSLLPIAFRIAN